MKIEKPGNSPPVGLMSDVAARTDKTAAAAQQSGTVPQPASTSVSLGTTATQLGKMEASMAKTPVIDANKVAEIKKAISEGRFQVNSGVVADRLIQSVRDLISNNSRV